MVPHLLSGGRKRLVADIGGHGDSVAVRVMVVVPVGLPRRARRDSGHDTSSVVLDRYEFYWQRAECVLHLDGVGLGLAQHEAGETLLGSGVLVFKQDIHAFGRCVFQILIMFYSIFIGVVAAMRPRSAQSARETFRRAA